MAGEGTTWRGRPPEVWALAALYLVGSALCLVGAVRPPTPATPRELDAVLVAIGIPMTAALWWGATRWRPLLHLALGTYVVGTTSTVAAAATGEGAMASSISFVWICVYAAVFFSRGAARAYVAVSVAGLAAGLAVSTPVASAASAWLVVALSATAACELLSWFHDRLRSLTVTDVLTGLPNRGGLVEAARRELATAARAGAPLTVGVIDLDDFKLVNDRDGHAAGDRLLVDLAAAWRRALRPRDVLARQGGDEFVLLLPDTTEADAVAVLDRLRAASPAGWSCGLWEARPGEDLDACLARADARMYEGKRARRRGSPAGRAPRAVPAPRLAG